MMRRAAVGNIRGAAMLLKKYAKTGLLDGDFLDSAQRRCVRCAQGLPPAPIAEVCRRWRIRITSACKPLLHHHQSNEQAACFRGFFFQAFSH